MSLDHTTYSINMAAKMQLIDKRPLMNTQSDTIVHIDAETNATALPTTATQRGA